MKIRASIYCRVSTASQAEEDKVSIPSQIAKCKEFIKKNGWQFVTTYTDKGYSSNTLDRPELQTLLKELGNFDVLVCYDPDRLSRDSILVEARIYTELDTHRVQTTFVSQPMRIVPPEEYDPREDDSVFVQRRISGLASGLDNRKRRRRLMEGLKAKVQQGHMVRGRAYGYEVHWDQCRENGKWKIRKTTVINKQEAEVLRRIFKDYIAGKGSLVIATELNAESIPSKRGCHWTSARIREILKNPIYYGKTRNNVRTTKNGKCVLLPMSEWVLIDGQHKPIISEEMFHKAKIVRERKGHRSRAIGSPKLLSGLVRCGLCGYSMWIDGGRHPYAAYTCGKKRTAGLCRRNPYNMKKLEEEVISYLHTMLSSPLILQKIKTAGTDRDTSEIERRINRLILTIEKFPKRKTRLFELYELGDISREEFRERKSELEGVQQSLEEELGQKEKIQERIKKRRITTEMIQKALNDFVIGFRKGDIMSIKKQKLSNLIESIKVKDGQFKVNFRFSHSA